MGCTSRQGTYLNRGLPSDYIALSKRDQPGGDSRRAGGIMVELILSESQLAVRDEGERKHFLEGLRRAGLT